MTANLKHVESRERSTLNFFANNILTYLETNFLSCFWICCNDMINIETQDETKESALKEANCMKIMKEKCYSDSFEN